MLSIAYPHWAPPVQNNELRLRWKHKLVFLGTSRTPPLEDLVSRHSLTFKSFHLCSACRCLYDCPCWMLTATKIVKCHKFTSFSICILININQHNQRIYSHYFMAWKISFICIFIVTNQNKPLKWHSSHKRISKFKESMNELEGIYKKKVILS